MESTSCNIHLNVHTCSGISQIVYASFLVRANLPEMIDTSPLLTYSHYLERPVQWDLARRTCRKLLALNTIIMGIPLATVTAEPPINDL